MIHEKGYTKQLSDLIRLDLQHQKIITKSTTGRSPFSPIWKIGKRTNKEHKQS